MKSNYVDRAVKFIEKILPLIEDCECGEDYEWVMNRYNRKYNRKVRVAWGQTRIAILCSDYVIKIDYGTNSCRWGDCESEYEHYLEAVRDGFDYLFAAITPVKVEGRTFYIMPRINGVASDRSADYDVDEWLTEEERDWVWDHIRDVHYENYGWKNRYPVIIDYAASCC